MKRSKPILSKLLMALLRPYLLGVVDADDEVQDELDQDEQGDQDGEQTDPEYGQEGEQDPNGAEGEGESGEEDSDGEDGELVVSLGEGDPDEAEDPEVAKSPVIREMRKAHKALIRERNQLREQLRTQQAAGVVQAQPVALGPEPTMDDEDVNYDEAKFKTKYAAWYNLKTSIENEQAETKRKQQAATQQWQSTVDAYKGASSKLKVRDFDLAESSAAEHLDVTQQGIILHMLPPDRAALVMYAVGRNPKVAKELAAVKDPMKFAYAVSKLELTQLKTGTKKPAPPPAERGLRSTTTAAAAVDSQLERLQKEADRTGDRTKVAKYIRDKQRTA